MTKEDKGSSTIKQYPSLDRKPVDALLENNKRQETKQDERLMLLFDVYEYHEDFKVGVCREDGYFGSGFEERMDTSEWGL